MALDYAKQRAQFGQPICTFQAIQFKLADMATEVESARWLVYRAAWLRDAGQPFAKEAAMAKLYASRSPSRGSRRSRFTAATATSSSHPVARFYCDAKILEIGEGTNEIQRTVIARALGC